LAAFFHWAAAGRSALRDGGGTMKKSLQGHPKALMPPPWDGR
jgi:hypothetical protein